MQSLTVASSVLWARPQIGAEKYEARLAQLFAFVLLARLLYPFFNSPLDHLFSDPLRHWETGLEFLHPNVMGSGDPFLYQLWLFLLRSAAGHSTPAVLLGCGLLCAAMPYGWYRAMREVLPRQWALATAICIAIAPNFMSVYGYFMNETLLLTLTGFAFWLTLRAARKRTLYAFAAATAVWLAAGYTRIVVLPMAALCLTWLWLLQTRKLRAASIAALLVATITVPAGLHGRAALHYFAPLGNLYLNEIYYVSGNKEIQIDYGAQGRFEFGSPSYYNASFYPFSGWLTSRRGSVAVVVDTRNGRDDWRRELRRVQAQGHAVLRDRWENLVYFLFAQAWPDNDRNTIVGNMSLWSRWLWLPMIVAVSAAAWRRQFIGRQWILPICALLSVALLLAQSEGPMEGRFRKPLEPLFVVALALSLHTQSIKKRVHVS
jgi:O-antigen ligase